MWAMINLKKCTPGEEGREVERSYVDRANFEDYRCFFFNIRAIFMGLADFLDIQNREKLTA